MKEDLLHILGCPFWKGDLDLQDAVAKGMEIAEGTLHCRTCSLVYPIIRCIPRFVPPENYASSFGFQWNRFRRTQLDSHTGKPIARERFLLRTGYQPTDLEGKRVLDVGCGAGRYAEVALSSGARLVALDYSSAVDACWQN